jgi:hypothetical protein
MIVHYGAALAAFNILISVWWFVDVVPHGAARRAAGSRSNAAPSSFSWWLAHSSGDACDRESFAPLAMRRSWSLVWSAGFSSSAHLIAVAGGNARRRSFRRDEVLVRQLDSIAPSRDLIDQFALRRDAEMSRVGTERIRLSASSSAAPRRDARCGLPS